MMNLGAVYEKKHNLKKAEELYKEALALAEAASGPSHPDLVFPLSALGVLYTEAGRYADAETEYRRALAILDADASTFATRIARILHGLAVTYSRAGRTQDRDIVFEQSAAIARQHMDEHPDMVGIIEDYAATLKKAGKTRAAEDLWTEARRARLRSSLVISAHSPF
jgi:tetratricopeptide (TPR) repeat protein